MAMKVSPLTALFTLALATAAACSTAYDTAEPNKTHIVAFTNVQAIYSLAVGTYAAAFTNSSSQAPLTLVSIIVANDPNLCVDLNKEYAPPNSSRLLLEGYVDGDVTKNTQGIPNTTWSQMSDALPLDATRLDTCYGTFFGYNAAGLIETALGVTSGTVTLGQSMADPNDTSQDVAPQIDVGYDLVIPVAGFPQSINDANITTPYCQHGG